MDRRFRIPRVTTAVLVLGGACRDGEGDSSNNRTQRNGDTVLRPGRKGDAAAGDTDSDGPAGPLVPTFPDASSPPNVPDALRLAFDKFCGTLMRCEPVGFSDSYSSRSQCVADLVAYAEEYVQAHGADCGDALAELYDCYGNTDCDELLDEYDTTCATKVAAAERACPSWY